MADRREFLKASIIVAAGVAAGRVSPAVAGGNLPAGLIYTADNQGKWQGKAKTHAQSSYDRTSFHSSSYIGR